MSNDFHNVIFFPELCFSKYNTLNIFLYLKPNIPGDTMMAQLTPTTKANVSQYMMSSTTDDLLATDTNVETSREPIKHDLSELGNKIHRILPPVHPAGNLIV